MDNRQGLMDSALTLFSERGYDAVGVQEIVEVAGVTKPTLYHYFDSKLGLLEALLERESTQLLSALSEATVYQRDIMLTLQKITRTYFDFASKHPVFYRMQSSMAYAPPESDSKQSIRKAYQAQLEILSGVFFQAVEDHGNLKGRQQRYALGLLGNINAMIALSLDGELELTETVVFETVHQFMHGIFS